MYLALCRSPVCPGRNIEPRRKICYNCPMETSKAEQEVTFIGKCNFRGNDRVFGIKGKDRRQHMYVIGKTGTGKTTLLKNLVLQDIRAGRGLGIIDPHGEFVEEVLDQIPPERTNDVVYFNPVDSEYPMGFNVLEVTDQKYKHLVVSDLLGIFTKIWANVWSARMEYILQNCIMALLDTPGTTLLGIPRILVDKDYRQKIVSNIKDPVVRSFWVHEYETWRDQFRNEAIVPIQNKVNQFLNTSFIRNIVGQPTSTLNVTEIMNDGKILLVNVSKGRVGEDNAQLLGAMIITKVQLAAMERVRIPEDERKDFYMYVDEFQNFATDSFASILSEARKYRLNLIIAHQYVGQLVSDVSTKVRDAVFGNTGTMIVFRVGAADAEYLETEFSPEFLPMDLINLPNYGIYLKLMVEGVTSRPFSAATLQPLKYENDSDIREKIINVSRERYARPRAEVEERISKWSGLSGEGEASLGGSGTTSSGTLSAGQLIETPCWNCGKTATVPFKPDGKRPVYCMNCLKQIEDGKLIPLPERMPQVGKAKFSQSLDILGIEFSSEGGRGPNPEAGQKINAPFGPARPQFSTAKRGEWGNQRDWSRQNPGVTSPRRDFRPPERDRQERRNELPRPASPIITSRPVVRTSQDIKPISLSNLRVKDASAPVMPEKKAGPIGEKKNDSPSSDLRKMLEEALKKGNQNNSAPGATFVPEQKPIPPPKSDILNNFSKTSSEKDNSLHKSPEEKKNNKDNEKGSNFINPGDTIKF